MARLEVPLVNESGRTIGYGDRWWTHRVRTGSDGPVLGQKHIGICIACVDDGRRILVAHRRHRIFDKVWSLSGDTHPYRMSGSRTVENLMQASRRCAMDDFGADIKSWTKALTVSYSARDPRDPRYCENELMYVMAARYGGPLRVNRRNAYELRWVEFDEISKDLAADLEKDPIDQKYAPWVYTVFALPREKVEEALVVS
jgi:isopentenyldiphosphate isomerase